ncbi:hypothetical protein [Nonlabens ponticola]|uniref:YgdI/YgdR family lipoprotein n=1 Tax=Nonlabens ponticola TaxID=2496866 RepID=A0A3S9MWK1_9FLAO|nr:hypothetical protein [Nonlabens ponticola]AZQ43522.1 hypothetical protein EJ995_04465 [Nonlabens ponticola]
MKKYFQLTLLCLALSSALISCRDEEQTQDEKVQEMIDNGDEVKIKEDKVKIENADGSETKIKYDEAGNVEKIKTDDN